MNEKVSNGCKPYVGETFDLPALVTGVPYPDITWTHDNKRVDESFLISNKADVSKLVKVKTKRTDSGQYKIHVSNIAGEASDSCSVDVLDKPGNIVVGFFF